jgi:hypothetical protein
MMMVSVFYSNYSGNSKALLQRIDNRFADGELMPFSVKYVNVDNAQMLNTVSKKIDVVPSIVVLENDQISLYSGENAFEWFNLHTSGLAKPDPVRDLRSTTPNPEEGIWRETAQPSSTVARALPVKLATKGSNPVHRPKAGLDSPKASVLTSVPRQNSSSEEEDIKLKVQEDGSKKTILEKAAELSQARDIDEETRFNRASLSSGHQKK